MLTSVIKRKRRAMTSEKARTVRAAGHMAETEFAKLIGGIVVPQKGFGRKKDVVDRSGDLHSVKSGKLKWQIFLYRKNRIQGDVDFQGTNLLARCLEAFPDHRRDYELNKVKYKKRLQIAMRALKDFLCLDRNKIIFFSKSFLNNGEVDYFTVKDEGVFRVFNGVEVVRVLDESTYIASPKARTAQEMDDLKVLFKLADRGITIGEIETRTDSMVHYRELKFWMHRNLTLNLLVKKISQTEIKYPQVIAHGKAIRTFR